MKTTEYFLFIFAIISLISFQGTNGVTIHNITVPSMVLITEENPEPISFNCLFDFDKSTKYLTMKWFKDHNVVFQWIYGMKPSVIPKYISLIESSPDTSKDKPAYNGMKILHPSIEWSGVYRCLVQTTFGTDEKERHMQIVDISNHTLQLHYHRIENETHLECNVDNVYPQPRIHLSADNANEINIISRVVNKQDNGFYNSTVVAVVNDVDDNEDEYTCTITFFDLPFNLTTVTKSASSNYYNHLSKVLLITPVFLQLLVAAI